MGKDCKTLVVHVPGFNDNVACRKPRIPYDAWCLLFTDTIVQIILERTNSKISAKYSSTAPLINQDDETEVSAFMSLHILCDMFKLEHDHVHDTCLQQMKQERILFESQSHLKHFIIGFYCWFSMVFIIGLM